jgi:hypothetical protein
MSFGFPTLRLQFPPSLRQAKVDSADLIKAASLLSQNRATPELEKVGRIIRRGVDDQREAIRVHFEHRGKYQSLLNLLRLLGTHNPRSA